MFSSSTLLSFLVLALTVNATPIQQRNQNSALGLVAKINASGSKNLADIDRARVAGLIAQVQGGKSSTHGKRADGTVVATDDGVTYTANVGVGSPPTDYTLLIDTGSSNTWVGADKAYVKTSTSQDTGNKVSVSYGSGNFSGEEYTDTVTLGDGLTISQQSIGVATTSKGLGKGIDGILGIGPTDLTSGTVDNTGTVPTVTDNLFSEGTITDSLVGIYFEPPNANSQGLGSGSLSFGQVETGRIVGSVNYVSLTATSPASTFWGIDQSISYGQTSLLAETAGIVDTGTTLILIATDAFQKYQSATGGTPDQATGLLKITSDQYNNLQPLAFTVGGNTYTLSPNAQIFPRSLNTAIGGDASGIYLIVADIGTPSGKGLDFINGYSFLQRFYSVYDTSNARVGLASTEYTDANSN